MVLGPAESNLSKYIYSLASRSTDSTRVHRQVTVLLSGTCRGGGHGEAPPPGQGRMEGWVRESFPQGVVLKQSCEGRVGRRPFKSGF